MRETTPRAFFQMIGASSGAVIALQHLFYAAMGGIHPQPMTAAALTLVTLAGAGMLLIALQSRAWLAWIGLSLVWIPLIVTYPVPFLSLGGLLYVLLLAVTTMALFISLFTPGQQQAAQQASHE